MFLNKKIYHVFVSLAVVALIASPFVYNKVKAATGLSVGSSSVTGSDDIIYGHGGDSTGNLLNLLNNSGASFVIDNSGNLDLSGTINSGGFTGTLNASNVSAGTFGSNTGGGNYLFPAGIGFTGAGSITANGALNIGDGSDAVGINSSGPISFSTGLNVTGLTTSSLGFAVGGNTIIDDFGNIGGDNIPELVAARTTYSTLNDRLNGIATNYSSVISNSEIIGESLTNIAAVNTSVTTAYYNAQIGTVQNDHDSWQTIAENVYGNARSMGDNIIYGNKMYIHSYSYGIKVLNLDTETWEGDWHESSSPALPEDDYLAHLAYDHDRNDIYTGAFNNSGLIKIDVDANTVTNYTTSNSNLLSDSFGESHSNSFYYYNGKVYLFPSNNYMQVFDVVNETFTNYGSASGLPSDGYYSVEGNGNELHISSSSGFYIWNMDTDTLVKRFYSGSTNGLYPYTSTVRSTNQDPNDPDIVWVATDRSWQKVSKTNGWQEFHRTDQETGLPNYRWNIKRIGDQLWLGSYYGQAPSGYLVYDLNAETYFVIADDGKVIGNSEAASSYHPKPLYYNGYYYFGNYSDAHIYKTQLNYETNNIFETNVLATTTNPITTAKFDYNGGVGLGNSIEWYLSANGGTNWEGPVTPNTLWEFTNTGTDLRARAVMTAGNGTTPVITGLEIAAYDGLTWAGQGSTTVETEVLQARDSSSFGTFGSLDLRLEDIDSKVGTVATHDHDSSYLQLTGGTLSGLLNVNANLNSNHILPNADNSFDLGSSSNTWNDVYTDNIEASTANFSGNVSVASPVNNNHATTKSYVDSVASSGGQWTDAGTYIYANNASNVTVNDSGYLGIGTTNPTNIFHISQSNLGLYTEALIENTASSGAVGFEFKTNTHRWKTGVNINDDYRIRDETGNANVFTIEDGSGTNSLYIKSGGNVGIGTTNPGAKLAVYDGTLPNIYLGGANSEIETTHDLYLKVRNDLRVQNYDGSSWNTNLYINDSSGNVGIGTTGPAYKLDVNGNARFTNTVTVGTPTSSSHATTKSYVDSSIGGLSNIYVDESGDTMTGTLTFNSSESSSAISSVFGTATTRKNRISFSPASGSNDPGYIVHETSGDSGYTNSGILHLVPTDDNSGNDYVTIHGTNDPETIKLYTSGNIETPGTVSVATPTASSHAATKNYVDSALISGDSDWAGVGGDPTLSGEIYHTGNVGIGTNNPAYPLEVDASTNTNVARFIGSNTSLSRFIIENDEGNNQTDINIKNTTGSLYVGVGYSGTNAYLDNRSGGNLTFRNSGTEQMTFSSSGDLGIGASTPYADLQIGQGTSGSNLLISGANSDIYGSELFFGDNGSSNSYQAGMSITYNSSNNSLNFWDNHGGSGVIHSNNRMTIMRDIDRVGINDPSPSYGLDVNGTGRFTGTLAIATPTAGSHATTKNYVDSAVNAGINGTTNYIPKFSSSNSLNSSIIYQSNSNDIGIGTTSLDPYAKLDVHGNLFIGTSSHSYTNPSLGYALVSEGSSSNYIISHNDGSGNFHKYYNAYYSTDGNHKLISDGGAYQWEVSSVTSGDLILWMANSTGVAGDPINWTKTLEYYTGGDTGIGDSNELYVDVSTSRIGISDTSPSYKLDVDGTGRFTNSLIVGTPTSSSHATTKSYVDSLITGSTYWSASGNDIYNNNLGQVLVPSLREVRPEADITQGCSVSVSGGDLINGGPTHRTEDSYWRVTSVGQSMTLNCGGWWHSGLSFAGSNRHNLSGTKMPAGFTVEKSTDGGVNWTTVDTVTGNDKKWYSTSFNDGPMLRITVNSFQSGETQAVISALQVYEMNDYATPSPFGYTGDGHVVHVGNNVGIGTNDPNEKLDINGGLRLQGSSASNQGFIQSLDFYNNYSSSENIIASIQARRGSNNYNAGELWLQTNSGSGMNTNMVIDKDGDIGINDPSPSYKLDVNGTGRFINNLTIPTPVSGAHAVNKDYVDPYLNWMTNGNHIYNSNTGNVGIGTNSPGSKLDVVMSGSGEALRLLGLNLDVDFHMGHDGNSTGFYWRYKGTHSGNDNDLELWAQNLGGTDQQVYNVKQDGNMDFYQDVSFTQPITIGSPVNSDHAATKNYVDSVLTNPTISGDLNMGGNDILGVNKLTVNTIDPLYEIDNVLYSSYAASVVGGVKEEYIGKTKINSYNSGKGEYEKVINFKKQKVGTDLWLWYKTVDFNKDNVDVFVTPYGSLANVYYEIKYNSIILRSDKSVDVSYRLIGKRFDWRSWPTKAKDQNQSPGLKID